MIPSFSDEQLREFSNIIMDEIRTMSGLVLFEVVIQWANKGRTGHYDKYIIAPDANTALCKAWEHEENTDLREVHIKWLCPLESIEIPAEEADV